MMTGENHTTLVAKKSTEFCPCRLLSPKIPRESLSCSESDPPIFVLFESRKIPSGSHVYSDCEQENHHL